MIRKLNIHNFKSHKKTFLDFSNLTVLCGTNGSGKSSIIQTFMLLRESYLSNSFMDFKYLNLITEAVNIGTIQDAFYQFNDTDDISFDIVTDKQNIHLCFEVKTNTDLTKTLIAESNLAPACFDKNAITEESLFNKNCQFISASRSGPQSSYPKDDVVVEVRNQISVKEGKAEYFIHYLMKRSHLDVNEYLKNSSEDESDLLSQTTAWEREISEGVDVVVRDMQNLGYELRYQFNSSVEKTNEFKAANVGFGLTYSMPVIVALLSAEQDAILFIENPEAHLHPKGQSKIAELICYAAQSGIQVVLETHSDHVINSILVNCKMFDRGKKGIDRENVRLYHFDRDKEAQATVVTPIHIEKGGSITNRPNDFFDQFGKDVRKLMSHE